MMNFPVRMMPLLVGALVATRALPVAAADDGKTSLILASGDASNNERVREAARMWLETRGEVVVDGGLKPKDAMKLAECLGKTPERCTDVIAGTGASRLWVFSLTPKTGDSGTDLDILLRLYARDGRALATGDIHCERCGNEVLAVQVEKVLDKVSVSAAALTSAQTVLRIRTDPAGGLVTVDGASVGTAVPEVAYNVLPGSHEIRVTKEGYEPGVRRVDLEDGEEKVVTVVMEPSAPKSDGKQPGNTRGLGPWPYVVGGVGVAALGTGGILFALHEPAERDGDQQWRSRDRLVSTVITTGVGVVAVGVAAYLFLRPRPASKRDVAPAVSVSGDSVYLGVAGGF